MEMIKNENFIGNQTFEEESVLSFFERNINLTESEMVSSTTWVDPFDSVLLKVVTILVYAIEVSASIIMMAFVVYETNGYNGHYRTLINQLVSHLYGGVGNPLPYSISICFIFFKKDKKYFQSI